VAEVVALMDRFDTLTDDERGELLDCISIEIECSDPTGDSSGDPDEDAGQLAYVTALRSVRAKLWPEAFPR
jgi:hypothetical protein